MHQNQESYTITMTLKLLSSHDGYGWRQVDNRAGAGRGYFAAGDPGSG